MKTKNLRHATYKHLYHIVWGTKFRYKYLKDYVKKELLKCFDDVIQRYPTLSIETVNVDKDHIHLQIEIPPNIAVSNAVQILKLNSSIRLKKKFKFIRDMYIEEDGIWSVGYFSSTI